MAATRAVLVTGSNTGIGRETSLRLARAGWRVFAGVRQRAAGEALAAEARAQKASVEPLILDVTNPSHIAAAAGVLQRTLGTSGLAALVNNAGIVIAGPVEGLALDQWRTQFEVNFFGQIAVTQAFLPLLRQAHGRIVLVSSVAGRVTQPFVAPYCASKYALEAVGDALRLELRSQNIGVTLVEPGAIKTPIWGKSRDLAESLQAAHTNSTRSLYGESMERVRNAMGVAEAKGLPPDAVAAAIERSLTAKRSPARIVVGADAKLAALAKSFLPTTWLDKLILKSMGLR
ncbi:MAG: SDR family oxidoreductase [Planctomycetota bacterium]